MDDGWKGRLGRDRAAPRGELGGLRSAWRAPAVREHRGGAAGAARRIVLSESPLRHPGGHGMGIWKYREKGSFIRNAKHVRLSDEDPRATSESLKMIDFKMDRKAIIPESELFELKRW